MRKTVAIIATALMVATVGACSTKSKSSTGGGSNSTPGATSSGQLGRGVTAKTVELGNLYVDFAALRKVINIDHGDYKAAYKAVIDDVNAHGGINGRQIVPFYAAVNPIGTAPAAAACTKLTEDNKVFVVAGFFQTPDTTCYVNTHDTPIVGTSLTPDQVATAKQPAFDTVLAPDHLAEKAVPALKEKGIFDGRKVAVVGAVADQSEMQNSILPALKKAGVDVVQTAINDAPTTDVNAGYQRYALIAKKFQAAGADLVVLVGSAGTGWPQGIQATHTNYYPRLVATLLDDLATYSGSTTSKPDPRILKDAIATAGGPDDQDKWNEPGMQACVAKIRAANPADQISDPTQANPKHPGTWVAPMDVCTYISLFTQLAKAAGPTLNNQTFTNAGNTLKNVKIPGISDPLNYSPGHHDGDGQVYIYQWDPTVVGQYRQLK